MYYSVSENSIIIEDFFSSRRLVWCVTLQGMLVGSRLCAYFHGAHTSKCLHASCICKCVSVRERVWQDKQRGGSGGGGVDRWFLSIRAFILPPSLWRQWSWGGRNTQGRLGDAPLSDPWPFEKFVWAERQPLGNGLCKLNESLSSQHRERCAFEVVTRCL